MVAALDSATATRAVSLLSAPPATGKYVAIKIFLTGAYELSCFLFLHLFMQQLPDYVLAPLSMSGINDYRALSQEADRIYISGPQRI